MAVRFQEHFHLDLPASVDEDGAPVACYKSRQRAPLPVVQTIVKTSWTGTRSRSTTVDSEGDPVVHNDVKLRVVGTQAQYETICDLLGRTVAFVDYYHPDAGEAHDSYVQTMALLSVTDVTGIGQKWNKIEFTIELQELG